MPKVLGVLCQKAEPVPSLRAHLPLHSGSCDKGSQGAVDTPSGAPHWSEGPAMGETVTALGNHLPC